MYSSWDFSKDLLGTAGSILVALPWFFDFGLRGRRDKARRLSSLSGPLEILKRDIVDGLVASLDEPRRRDFILTLLGLLLIVASFALGLLHGLIEVLA